MHHAFFGIVLLILAGLAVFIPGALAIAIYGCAIAIPLWVYFSLRHIASTRDGVTPVPSDASSFTGSGSVASGISNNVFADLSGSGLDCKSGDGGSSHV